MPRKGKPMNGLFDQLQRELKERGEGLAPPAFQELSPLERKTMSLFLRHGHLSLVEVTELLQTDRDALQPVLDTFVAKGWLLEFQVEGAQHYRTRFAQRGAREVPLDIWARVKELIECRRSAVSSLRPPATISATL